MSQSEQETEMESINMEEEPVVTKEVTPIVAKEVATLETMNELAINTPKEVEDSKLSSTPLENVERDLSTFTQDMFNVIRAKNNFNKAIEDEIERRLTLDIKDGGFDSRELIALQNNSSVNLNDMVSKVLGPTFQLMTAEQQAVYAAKQAEAKSGSNITINTANMGNDQMKQLNESKDVDQQTLQGLYQLNNLLQGLKSAAKAEDVDSTEVK